MRNIFFYRSNKSFPCVHGVGGLLEYLCVGVSYADQQVSAAACYALMPVLGEGCIRDALPLPLCQNVIRGVLAGLAEGSGHRDSQINMLGVYM